MKVSKTLFQSILFVALVRFVSFLPACISCGFLTIAVLEGEGPSLTPNHRMVDQASIFIFSGDRVVHPHAGHLVSFLVASSDKCGLR